MREKIIQTMREAVQGPRKVAVTFKKDRATDVRFLIHDPMFMDTGYVALSDKDYPVLRRAFVYGKFPLFCKRTFTVTLSDKLTDEWIVALANHISPAIENIEVVQ